MEEKSGVSTVCKYRHATEKEWKYLHTEDEKPLTIVCHSGGMVVDSNNHIIVDFAMTTYHGERVVKIDPVAKAWIEDILGFGIDGIEPKDRPPSVRHVIGLVDLPIKLMQIHKRPLPFFFKEPETSLHPSQQVKIANLVAAMINGIQDDGSFKTLP